VGSYATLAYSLAVASGRLYAVNNLNLTILDVTNPAVPTLLSTSNSHGAQGVAAAGTLVYLASPIVDPSVGTGGLYVIDATVPVAPRMAAHSVGGFASSDVAVGGSLAVATGSGNGIGTAVVDVSTPSAP